MIQGAMLIDAGSVTLQSDPREVRRPTSGYLWLDITQQRREDLDFIQHLFNLHPLALEDCEHMDQRPKLERFDDHYFLVMHAFEWADDTTLRVLELHIFAGPDFVITLHDTPLPCLDHLWHRVLSDSHLQRQGADELLYRICDTVVDHHMPVLEVLHDALDDVEDKCLSGSDPGVITQLVHLKRSLAIMRRLVGATLELFNELSWHDSSHVSDAVRPYFRDIHDHLIRLREQLDNDRDLLANAREAHFSVLSQRTNDTMKRLTLMSVIFLPLTFITGFFGMNFEHLPFSNDLLMYGAGLSMVLVPGFMLMWFWRQRWFE